MVVVNCWRMAASQYVGDCSSRSTSSALKLESRPAGFQPGRSWLPRLRTSHRDRGPQTRVGTMMRSWFTYLCITPIMCANAKRIWGCTDADTVVLAPPTSHTGSIVARKDLCGRERRRGVETSFRTTLNCLPYRERATFLSCKIHERERSVVGWWTDVIGCSVKDELKAS